MNDLTLENYIPADGILLSGDRTKTDLANYNQIAGPAKTVFMNGKPHFCGGVRISIGEAWFIMSEELRQELQDPRYIGEKRQILELCKEQIEKIMRDNKLYRLYAEALISEHFCEVLGFKKKENIYVKE